MPFDFRRLELIVCTDCHLIWKDLKLISCTYALPLISLLINLNMILCVVPFFAFEYFKAGCPCFLPFFCVLEAGFLDVLILTFSKPILWLVRVSF